MRVNLGGYDINIGKLDKAPRLRRCLAFFLAASLICSQSFAQVRVTAIDSSVNNSVETIRLAQASTSFSTEIDIDPPIIDHEALENGRSGEPQEFKAGVIDDRGLKHVMLFHRSRSGVQYQSAEMQSVAGSNDYSIVIETELGQTRVEYYIEALDTGGNRVLKGFPFFPLVRELTAPTASVAQEPESPATQSRLIYVLLGVAAVGIVAALVGGSDDGDRGVNGGGTTPVPNTVPLNIQVTPP